jgi:toxin ParE1/3/4
VKRLTVRFRPAANEDVQAIFDWIATSSGHSESAEKFIYRIFDRCEQLRDFPELGVARDDLSKGIRLLTFEKRAAIFYRIVGTEIQITNIFYAGRDYDETTFDNQ